MALSHQRNIGVIPSLANMRRKGLYNGDAVTRRNPRGVLNRNLIVPILHVGPVRISTGEVLPGKNFSANPNKISSYEGRTPKMNYYGSAACTGDTCTK